MERRIQELEEAGDLLDHRVVPAGLEEGGPVPPAPLEEVLAPGGVGQHAVDVEDDRGPPAGRGLAPRPVRPSVSGRRAGHESPA